MTERSEAPRIRIARAVRVQAASVLWANTASPDCGSALMTEADSDSDSVSPSSPSDSFALPISACI